MSMRVRARTLSLSRYNNMTYKKKITFKNTKDQDAKKKKIQMQKIQDAKTKKMVKKKLPRRTFTFTITATFPRPLFVEVILLSSTLHLLEAGKYS